MTMVPIVASADEIPAAIEYANKHPNSRWYVARRLEAHQHEVPEEWGLTAAKMPKLGTGKRFSNLTSQLGKRGVRNPGALAAWIGRKKFGKKKFQQLGAKARTASSAVTADAGMPPAGWLSAVRATILEAGVDPDVIESGVGGGFATAYDGEQEAVAYATDLLETFVTDLAADFPEILDGDDDDEDEDGDTEDDAGTSDDTTVEGGDGQQPAEEPQVDESAPPAQMPAPMPVAASGYPSGPLVYVAGNGAPPAYDTAALTAAVKAAVHEELAILAARLPLDDEDVLDQGADDATEPDAPVPPDAGPDTTDQVDESAAPPEAASPPMDVDAAKASLREKFGGIKKKTPPVPVAASANRLDVAAMRARTAARSGT